MARLVQEQGRVVRDAVKKELGLVNTTLTVDQNRRVTGAMFQELGKIYRGELSVLDGRRKRKTPRKRARK